MRQKWTSQSQTVSKINDMSTKTITLKLYQNIIDKIEKKNNKIKISLKEEE